MSRASELEDDEIELIEEALAELPHSDLLSRVKVKLVRAAEPEPAQSAEERGSEG